MGVTTTRGLHVKQELGRDDARMPTHIYVSHHTHVHVSEEKFHNPITNSDASRKMYLMDQGTTRRATLTGQRVTVK